MQKAKDLLEETGKYPKIFGFTKEVLILRVSTILEMALDDFAPQLFYRQHLRIQGSMYSDIQEEFDDAWANNLVNSAIKLLNRNDNP